MCGALSSSGVPILQQDILARLMMLHQLMMLQQDVLAARRSGPTGDAAARRSGPTDDAAARLSGPTDDAAPTDDATARRSCSKTFWPNW